MKINLEATAVRPWVFLMLGVLALSPVLVVAHTKLTVAHTAASKLSPASDTAIPKNTAIPTPTLKKLQTKDLGHGPVSGRLGF